MTGIILMTVGTLSFIIGLTLFVKNDNKKEEKTIRKLDQLIEIALADGVLTTNEKNTIEKFAKKEGLNYPDILKDIELRLAELDKNKVETELIDINRKNGFDFEKYIVKKINPKYFKIIEWAGDKYIDGKFALTTSQPDLLMELKIGKNISPLSIECKWRKQTFKGGIEIGTNEQITNYRNFQDKRGIPVFIAIGLGGTGQEPKHLYLVPLKEIHSNFIENADLLRFEKKDNGNLYFDVKSKILK